VLSRALRGENVDKQQLDAARSLFSYRADSPPERRADGDYDGPRMPDGSRPISLGDVLEFAMSASESTRAVAEAWIAQAQRATPESFRADAPLRHSDIGGRTANHHWARDKPSCGCGGRLL
jgi:hypothetical protein